MFQFFVFPDTLYSFIVPLTFKLPFLGGKMYANVLRDISKKNITQEGET